MNRSLRFSLGRLNLSVALLNPLKIKATPSGTRRRFTT